jgi:hypothetical protein
MSGTRRRCAVAGLVAAVLVGIFLHGGVTEPTPLRTGPAPAVADWAPAGVVPAAFRVRTAAEADLLSLADLGRGRGLGLVPAGLAGVLAGVLAWWCVAGAPGPGAHRPPRAVLPGRRAPPALAPS